MNPLYSYYIDLFESHGYIGKQQYQNQIHFWKGNLFAQYNEPLNGQLLKAYFGSGFYYCIYFDLMVKINDSQFGLLEDLCEEYCKLISAKLSPEEEKIVNEFGNAVILEPYMRCIEITQKELTEELRVSNWRKDNKTRTLILDLKNLKYEFLLK